MNTKQAEDYNLLVDWGMTNREYKDIDKVREICKKYKQFLDSQGAVKDPDNIHYKGSLTEHYYNKQGDGNGKEKF